MTMQNLQTATPRRIVMVMFPDAQILDITGPMEIFAAVGQAYRYQGLSDRTAYETLLVSHRAGPVTTTSGMRLMADEDFETFTGPIDTLLICGGEGTEAALNDIRLMDFVRRTVPAARRVAAVCTGTFILAKAGFLAGRRATTHWRCCNLLARHFPDIKVDSDAIYVRDGKFCSSAGVTAGMDLALALVAEDFGHEMALTIAREKVLFMIRPGGQSQFSAQLLAQQAGPGRIGALCAWILDNVREPLTVQCLAERAGLSERTFVRAFTEETGLTPGRFVESARIDAARRHLETSAESVDQIALSTGFGNAERMRRAFHRRLGVSPQDYRSRFRFPTKNKETHHDPDHRPTVV